MAATKTRQELFDNAWRQARRQGWARSLNDDGECCYRTATGERCNVGANIPDELYEEAFEGWACEVDEDELVNSIAARIRSAAGIADSDIEFANDLQDAHDNMFSDMRGNMRKLVEKYGLTIPEGSAV